MIKKSLYFRFFKRPLDILLSLISLIILSPIIIIVAIIVKLKIGSPIIFKQKRPGLNEKTFILYKFRTMTDKKDSDGNLLPNNMRLTKIGKILRALSLDELPSLINILKGDMSFVGPRPLLVEYLQLYNDEQRKRHLVRPGLTGLAQVNGRNSITWEQKFKYDLKYIEKITLFKDIKIILKTFFKVLKRDGINKDNNTTMDKFNGEN